MEKSHAEAIARRIPGAKIVQDAERRWTVKARCAGGERITLEDDDRLYLEADDRRCGPANALGYRNMVAAFSSAIAAAALDGHPDPKATAPAATATQTGEQA